MPPQDKQTWVYSAASGVRLESPNRKNENMSNNKHDDRLNKLEQWLETYGDDVTTVEHIRLILVENRTRIRELWVKADDHKLPAAKAGLGRTSNALTDLANIVGVGLENL